MILTSIFVDLNPAGFVRKVVVLGVICTHQSAQSEWSCTFVQSLLVSGSAVLRECRKIRDTHSYRTFLSRKNAVKTNRKLRRGKACYVSLKGDTGAIWSYSKHKIFPRGKFLSGTIVTQRSLTKLLPTFCYHWATFLIPLTLFFPCDFHCAVTKTVLSTNIRSVYLCCFNAIQLNQQTHRDYYETPFYWHLF